MSTARQPHHPDANLCPACPYRSTNRMPRAPSAGEIDIPLFRIRTEEGLQVRQQGLDPGHLASLRLTDPADWEPIRVMPTSEGDYLVVDGHHRFKVAQEMHLGHLHCLIIQPSTERAILRQEAVELNAEHGLRLSMNDRRAYALSLHRDFPDLGTHEIAQLAHLSDETANKLLLYHDNRRAFDLSQRRATVKRFIGQVRKIANEFYEDDEQSIAASLYDQIDAITRTPGGARAAAEISESLRALHLFIDAAIHLLPPPPDDQPA